MSKEYKNKSEIEVQTLENPDAEAAPLVAYESWFVVQLQTHKKIQAHHYPTILAYFKKNNITELEPESAYDSMLKKFGY